jgi:death-on-curing family protein
LVGKVLPVGGAVGKIASKLGRWGKVAKPKKRQERIGGKGGVKKVKWGGVKLEKGNPKVTQAAKGSGEVAKQTQQLLKVKGNYLNKPENVSKLSQELTDFNMKHSELLGIFIGSVDAALHSAIYHETVLEQSAAVFQGIIKNHTFIQANKRTATEAFRKILQNNGLPCNIPREKFIEIGLKVDKNILVEIKEIAEEFARVMKQ